MVELFSGSIFKQSAGLLSVVVCLIQYVPYGRRTFRREIRPHVFSYYIWALSAGIVAVAQAVSNAGAGSWAMAISAAACLAIGILSARAGTDYVTRGDWIALGIALISIPLWIITKSPLMSVILLTIIDGAAYQPTLRKAWITPYEENASAYAVGWVKHLASLAALDTYNWVTVLTPAFIIFANGLLIGLLVLRRLVMKRK